MAYKKSKISKKAILDAAKQLAEEKGYDGMTIREICKLTGFSTGSFYHHFSTKDDLIKESFILFDSTITQEAYDVYDTMNPIEAIKSIMVSQAKFIEELGVNLMREYYRAQLLGIGRGAIAPVRVYYKAVKLYAEKAQAQGLLTGDKTAEQIAEFVIKGVRGSFLDWCLCNGEYNVVDRVRDETGKYLSPFVTAQCDL